MIDGLFQHTSASQVEEFSSNTPATAVQLSQVDSIQHNKFVVICGKLCVCFMPYRSGGSSDFEHILELQIHTYITLAFFSFPGEYC